MQTSGAEQDECLDITQDVLASARARPPPPSSALKLAAPSEFKLSAPSASSSGQISESALLNAVPPGSPRAQYDYWQHHPEYVKYWQHYVHWYSAQMANNAAQVQEVNHHPVTEVKAAIPPDASSPILNEHQGKFGSALNEPLGKFGSGMQDPIDWYQKVEDFRKLLEQHQLTMQKLLRSSEENICKAFNETLGASAVRTHATHTPAADSKPTTSAVAFTGTEATEKNNGCGIDQNIRPANLVLAPYSRRASRSRTEPPQPLRMASAVTLGSDEIWTESSFKRPKSPSFDAQIPTKPRSPSSSKETSQPISESLPMLPEPNAASAETVSSECKKVQIREGEAVELELSFRSDKKVMRRSVSTTSNDSMGLGNLTTSQMLAQLNHVQQKVSRNQGRASQGQGPIAALFHTASSLQQAWTVTRMVHSSQFNNFVALLIIINTVVIGVQTEWEIRHIGQPTPGFFEWAELAFCVLFSFELCTRVFALGRKFLTSSDWKWNLFDVIIVVSSVAELILTKLMTQDFTGLLALRALRVLRLVRTIRAVRVMKIFRELRLVVFGILNSISSLFWLIVLLIFFMFMVAVYITQTVTEELNLGAEGNLGEDPSDQVILRWGGMMPTFYCLYMAISNGSSWGVLADSLWKVSPVLGWLFVAYIAFAVFAVLNVVTGVFVDNAQKASEKDADHSLMEDTSERQRHIEAVAKVFQAADADSSGELTLEEFEHHFKNPSVRAYFRLLKLDIEMISAKRVFELLDFDGDGKIDIDEFVKGCTKLRGQAKAVDIAMLQSRSNKQVKQLVDIQDTLDAMYTGLAHMEQRLLLSSGSSLI